MKSRLAFLSAFIGRARRDAITGLNTATASAINTLANCINALSYDEGAKEQWQLMVPYGEYPAMVDIDGVPTLSMQILDRAAGELMQQNFATVANTIKHLGRGLPIYIGHPDNRKWLAENPGADSSAKGRIKGVEPREDGIYMLTAYNEQGRELIGGDAPKFSAQSPNWDMVPIEPGSKRFRPFVLRSIGLTNQPNISECAIGLNTAGANQASPTDAAGAVAEPENEDNDTMKLTAEALKALGFAPDATPTPEEISAAIVKMHSEKASADAAKATAESSVAAANTRASTAETELGNLRTSLITTAINSAIGRGAITEADKGTWEAMLKASPAAGVEALAKLGPVNGINTENHLGDQSKRKGDDVLTGQERFTAINTAVDAYAKEHGLDLMKATDHEKAHRAVQAAKPELFK